MYMAEPFLGKGIGKPHRFSDGRPFALGSMRAQKQDITESECDSGWRRRAESPTRRALLVTFPARGKSNAPRIVCSKKYYYTHGGSRE